MLKLHGYWRSSAAYRVRIALALKGLDYEQVTHDLRKDEQSSPGYRALNPQGLVPAIDDGDHIFGQSPAILEWLEETYTHPALLPADKAARAHIRAMMAIIACDIHPLNNLRVLKSLKHDLKAEQSKIDAWVARWITAGFDAFEEMIARHGKGFSFGDQPTFADCCLIPQIYNAQRFNIDLAPYPLIRAVNAACDDLPAFARAHPQHQPDADPPADS